MAGDWIKMRIELQTHPKVFRMVSALKADRLRIIGGLHIAWSIFDTHCDDGVLVGYTTDAMDAVIGWPGFTQAMIDVEWAALDDTGSLVMPRFDEHNGKSAKRRANDNERKRNSRNGEPVPKMSASDADKKRTREEKSREEKKEQDQETCSAREQEEFFSKFWALYPLKVGKANALKSWMKLKLTDELFAEIAGGLAKQVVCADWTKDGGQYVPHPTTWLNGKRWEDEVKVASNVHQFPGKSRHTELDQIDHAANLEVNADGSYRI
jgi:hypothetical protein